MLPLPLREQVNMDFDKRAAYMKKLHEETRTTLEKHNKDHATKMNKNKRAMIFEEGDLVWYTFATATLLVRENLVSSRKSCSYRATAIWCASQDHNLRYLR